jgi:predicted RNA-binding Zn ribbon-like protein
MGEAGEASGIMRDHADVFDWSGGHPALDLVNTLDERPFDQPVETLVTYRDLIAFVELAGLVEPSTAAGLAKLSGRKCSDTLERTRELREQLHDVLRAIHSRCLIPPRDLDAISTAIQFAHASRRLVAAASQSLAGHRWSDMAAAEIPLHACAIAVEHLLTDVDRVKVRKCGALDCDVYFVDTSKSQHRQWCSMKGCGNREKQRRRRSPSRIADQVR